ncbi:MAG: glycoside hydrolase, partial [Bacteroidetes bacterium]|nr:glycoside hydrolase [Bacteroidota bacterium]
MRLVRPSLPIVRTCVLLIFLISLPMTAQGQTKESIDQNLAALNAASGCLEGYAGSPEGSIIQYPRIRSDYPQALLTRTTTGAMGIAWQTVPVPAGAKASAYSFVVRAGIQSQPGVARNFDVFINDVTRFVITTTEKTNWSVQGKEGGSLTFTGVMRDQFNDAFGYLRFNLPAEWVTPGAPARIRIVGEKAGLPTWLMVYQDTDNLSYLKGKADHEAYCDLSIAVEGKEVTVHARGSSNLVGKPLECETSTGEKADTEFSPDGAHAVASLSYRRNEGLPSSFLLDRQKALLPKELAADST